MIELSPTLSTILITVGTSLGTGFGTWIFSKKKYQADTESTQIDNMKQSLEFYVDICNDSKARLDKLQDENGKLTESLEELKAENQALKDLVEKQTALITNLTTKVSRLEKILESKKDKRIIQKEQKSIN